MRDGDKNVVCTSWDGGTIGAWGDALTLGKRYSHKSIFLHDLRIGPDG
jgi:hypothetical protein